MSASEVWQATIFNYLQRLNMNLGVLFVKSVGRVNVGYALPEKDAIDAVFQLCKRKRMASAGSEEAGTKLAAKRPKLDTSSDSSDSSDSGDSKAENDAKKALATTSVAVPPKQPASTTKPLNPHSRTAKQPPNTKKSAIVLDSDSDSDSSDSDEQAVTKLKPKEPAAAATSAKQPTNTKITLSEARKASAKPVSSESDSDSDSDDYTSKRPVIAAQRSAVSQGTMSAVPPPKLYASAAAIASQKKPLVSHSPMGPQKAATKPIAPLSSSSDSDSDIECGKPKLKSTPMQAPKPTVQTLPAAAKAKATVNASANANAKAPAGAKAIPKLTASTTSSDSSDSDCHIKAVSKPVATTAVSKVAKANSAPIPITKAPAVVKRPLPVDSSSDSDSSTSCEEPVKSVKPVAASKATPTSPAQRVGSTAAAPSVKPTSVVPQRAPAASQKAVKTVETDSDEDSSSSDEDDAIKPIAARNEPPPTQTGSTSAAATKLKPGTAATTPLTTSASTAKPKPSPVVAKKPAAQSDSDSSSDSDSDDQPAQAKAGAFSVKKDVPPNWITDSSSIAKKSVSYETLGSGGQDDETESSSESEKPGAITQPNLGNRGGRGGSPRGGPRGGARGGSCYRCGEVGHISKFCTSPAKNADGASPRRSCYNCGEEGHVSHNCPQQSSSNRGGPRGRGSPGGVQQGGRGRGRGAGFFSSRSIPTGASPNKVIKFNDDD